MGAGVMARVGLRGAAVGVMGDAVGGTGDAVGGMPSIETMSKMMTEGGMQHGLPPAV